MKPRKCRISINQNNGGFQVRNLQTSRGAPIFRGFCCWFQGGYSPLSSLSETLRQENDFNNLNGRKKLRCCSVVVGTHAGLYCFASSYACLHQITNTPSLSPDSTDSHFLPPDFQQIITRKLTAGTKKSPPLEQKSHLPTPTLQEPNISHQTGKQESHRLQK